ncbi:DUF6585 family protein [Hamadaea tsunoensis]|uniref:DUF6585 family protein n=1 Tax=Hamadaea tsunoensis TaxID=53368 RepID=UPI0003FA0418|nr:DUF6585 family protein [Hamadaea tsunoensis]
MSTTPTAAYLPQSLSAEAVSVAIEHRLGQHVATFPRAKGWRRIIAGVLLGVVFVPIGLGIALSAVGDDAGEAAPMILLGSIFGLIGLGFLGFAGYLATQSPVFSAKAAARPFQSFANGYIEMAKTGPVAYRFDQMATVFQEITTTYVNGVNTGTNYIYRITMTDGRKVRLHSNNTNMAAFGPVIQRGVAEAHVPLAIDALRAGHPIPFGDVQLTQAGLQTGKGVLPWPEISDLRVQRGYVFVDRAGKRISFFSRQCKRIPNLPVFLTLLDRGRQTAGRF